MALALLGGWNLRQVAWIYCVQSVIIGWFNLRRMLALGEYSSANIRGFLGPLKPTARLKTGMAAWFALQYGGLHILFLVFLFMKAPLPAGLDLAGAVLCAAVFYFDHRASFYRKKALDSRGKTSLALLFMFPYARVLPMHAAIAAGAAVTAEPSGAAWLFIALKTAVDLVMSAIEYLISMEASR